MASNQYEEGCFFITSQKTKIWFYFHFYPLIQMNKLFWDMNLASGNVIYPFILF